MKARVHVTLKNGVHEVRQGKVIEFELAEDDRAAAADKVAAMCEKLLANTVIENYAIELDGTPVPKPSGAQAEKAIA